MFTETPRKLLEEIQVNGLNDLSLDHDKPLQNILDNVAVKRNFPKLNELRDAYANYINGGITVGNYLLVKDIRNFKKYSPGCYKHNLPVFNETFTDALFVDIKALYKDIDFSIMLKSYNSSKGKGCSV